MSRPLGAWPLIALRGPKAWQDAMILRRRLFGLGLLLGLCFGGDALFGQTPDSFATAAITGDGVETLNLLVILNGRDTGLVAAFERDRVTGTISATAADLASLGILLPFGFGKSVALTALPQFEAVYDAPSQTLKVIADARYLTPRELSARPSPPPPQGQPGWGVVLNYQANTALGDDLLRAGLRPKALYVSLDLRAATPIGVFKMTGTALKSSRNGALIWSRNDTAFVHLAQTSMASLTLGDFVSTGQAGTTALRMGGLQFKRDFSANRSFVTDPSLSYTGVAVLPSGLDVYINALRIWSGAVDAGPFTLRDIPTLSPQGEAVFVLHDASGAEKISRVSFFRTQNLLRRGVADYALQTGFARESFGDNSFAYGKDLIGLASVKYGLSDQLTLSGQIEAAKGLVMLGGGIDTALFNRVELGLFAAQSQSANRQGHLAGLTIRRKIAGFELRASLARSFGGFDDLASFLTTKQSLTPDTARHFASAKFEQAISLAIPITAQRGAAGVSYLRSKRGRETVSILSATYSRAVNKAALQINGFTDLSADDSFGLSIGMSFPIGKSGFSSAQIVQTPRGRELQASAARQAGRSAGDSGYRLALYRQNSALNSASTLTRQSRFARTELNLRSHQNRLAADVSLTGAIVFAAGAVFLTPQIQDGYAVVDVGAAGVEVSLNNRPAAKTGPRGRALLSDLRSYQSNRISIDPLALPLNVTIAASAMQVVPMRDSGVYVSFGGSVDAAALVVLRDATGSFLPVGTLITLLATGANFPMGYDGQVWLEGLKTDNKITAVSNLGSCAASFAFHPDPTAQVFIDAVVCQ